jgi:hypothetical protein
MAGLKRGAVILSWGPIDELGLWRLTADKIAEIFGTRLSRRMRGKLATIIDRIEHGHHVFRAYFKNAFLKQYEKFGAAGSNDRAAARGLRQGGPPAADHLRY